MTVDTGIPTSPKIVRVRPNDDFSLTIAFKTGEVKRFDVTPYLDASDFFRELADPAYFRKVFPDGSAVEWPHGQSFCSDTLVSEWHSCRKLTQQKENDLSTALNRQKVRNKIMNNNSVGEKHESHN